METTMEIQELRNKLRMMNFPQADSILSVVRRQQRAIRSQREANRTLTDEIAQYETTIAYLEQSEMELKSNTQIQRLSSEKKRMSSELSMLTIDYQAENQKRKKLEEEVSLQQSRFGGMYSQSKELEDMEAKRRRMENRLQQSLLKYNENLDQLQTIRNQLDEVRKDRHNFQAVMKRTEQQRVEADQLIGDHIKSSNIAYSERDQLKMQLNELKSAEQEDVTTYESEMSRMTQAIETARVAQDRPMNQAIPLQSTSSMTASSNDASEELQRQIDELLSPIVEVLRILQYPHPEKGNIQELINDSEALDSQNFSLYQFVVESGAEMATLQESIMNLRQRKEELFLKNETTDNEMGVELENLSHAMESTESKIDRVERELADDRQEMAMVYDELNDFYNELGLTWDDCPDDNANITTTNASFVLTKIEHEIANLMDQVAEKAKQDRFARQPDMAMMSYSDLSEATRAAPRSPTFNQKPNAANERDLNSRTAEFTKPLTLDELRALL